MGDTAEDRGSGSRRRTLVRLLLPALAVAAVWVAFPSGASAAANNSCEVTAGPNGQNETEYTCWSNPYTVGPYEVLQNLGFVPRPNISGTEYITHMEVDLVNSPSDPTPVPINRLMLHHIVFTNLNGTDKTCPGGFKGFDGRGVYGTIAPERFYAAGEERAKMTVPEGYGYEVKDTDAGFWPLIYMFMNHRNQDETATVQYKVVVDSDPLKPVEPYWFDVENCQADPIYNVPGGDKPGSTDVVSADYTFPSDARIIGGGGHVHGGAKKLTLTQPDCNNRKVGESFPTWGLPSHPFYNVRPILHEPGPINMSAFGTEQGIPVEGGTRVRLNSLYDNERPHTRVMGIFVVFVDENPGTSLNAPVNGACASLPTDTQTLATDQPGRRGAPPPFKIPLTGLDTSVSPPHAIKISAPPGKLKRVKNGATIEVGDRFFSKPNVEIRAGAALNYKFTGVPSSSLESLHNLTLATGPFGIGSPNLDGGRVYKQRFKRPGTYRFFCGLHPTQMQQRVVVEPKARKGKGK